MGFENIVNTIGTDRELNINPTTPAFTSRASLFEISDYHFNRGGHSSFHHGATLSTAETSTISSNQSLSGTLSTTDLNNLTGSGRYKDNYQLIGAIAGQQIRLKLKSSDFDTYLRVFNASTGQLVTDNNDANGTNSRLDFVVQSGINYLIRATSYYAKATGTYTLSAKTVTPTTSFNSNSSLARTEAPSFNSTYGYGLVNAAAAVASAIGQSAFADVAKLGGNNWGNDLVNAPEAWARGYTGRGITVAVIDSGINIGHSDLSTNIWRNTREIAGNGIDDDANGYVDDINGWNFGVGQNNNSVRPGTTNYSQGHGTHVAGIIAAINNSLGTTGVAYNSQIMAIRMGDVNSGGVFTNAGNVAKAIRYAVDNGAKVINISLGLTDSTQLRDALAYAASRNVITVSAAGNSRLSSPGNPASYATQYGISVGAVDTSMNIASFSNRAGLNSNMQHVVAPGVSVYSTLPRSKYGFKSGTSMATPYVAGVVALMLSANPNLTHAQVRQILTSSATRLA